MPDIIYTITESGGESITYEISEGQQGLQGEQGPAGADGAPGADGAQGIQGEQGPAGADGAQGIQGEQGPAGADGAPGADGSDANVTNANVNAAITTDAEATRDAAGLGAADEVDFGMLKVSTDVGLSRYAAGIISIGDGTLGDEGGKMRLAQVDLVDTFSGNPLKVRITSGGISMRYEKYISWSADLYSSTADTVLTKENGVAGKLKIGTAYGNASGSLALEWLDASGPVAAGSYTVATRPAAASYPGGRIYVTDAPRGRKTQISDGTGWIPILSDDYLVPQVLPVDGTGAPGEYIYDADDGTNATLTLSQDSFIGTFDPGSGNRSGTLVITQAAGGYTFGVSPHMVDMLGNLSGISSLAAGKRAVIKWYSDDGSTALAFVYLEP